MIKHKFSKTLFSAIVVGSALLGSTSLFAQVKIGTNPTTINPANNLEVESSTVGNKVSVDKTTGKVTIADGSQGNGKVLTSDANGVATWQTKEVLCSSFDVYHNAQQIIPINDPNDFTYTTLIPNTETYDANNSYNQATGEFTVPESGFYNFKGSCGDFIAGVTGSTRNTTIGIFSAARGNLAFSVVQAQAYTNGSYNNVFTMNYLQAGDKITFKAVVVHATGPKPAATIPVVNIQFSGSRVDCNKNN
ncbi:C1q-like domain-containing protein [Dyadobacter diqingensis]|uniref:C1q-like domain-containing protein n=1 Tax=Dyadobacter diqingensis TaxID=2938121 RepID=UPI0020C1AAE9|nr:hypothetical protein [Dyadobacter diqingensis]